MCALALTSVDAEISDDCAAYYADPFGWVMWAFPWGEGELEGQYGPDVWQEDLLREWGEQIRLRAFDGVIPVPPIQFGIASGHGIGKGHPVDMPYGSGVWGDLKPGDVVFNAAGKPVPVLSVNHYKREHYCITFDDGSSVVVSGQHEWVVRGRQERRKKTGAWRILETQELLRLGVKRPNGITMSRQWEIPIQGCVDYPKFDAPVDAYTYGVWLGDGDKNTGRITNIDEEVWENLAYEWNQKIKGITKTLLGLKNDLVSAGLFGCTTYTASVDPRYLYSDQRLSVLQGLLDTDGWVEECGSAAFSSASRQLTKDVITIARSLGLKARIEKFKDNDFAGSWTTHITWDGHTELFRIKRKQEKLIHAEHRYQCRWIDSISSVGLMEGMCIEVPGGKYLTPDFHVTHNSALTAWIILFIASTRPHSKGIVTANTSDQLRTKTWAELGKWRRMCITGHWFEYNNGRGSMSLYHINNPETWRVDAQTCREENSESFAGLHCANSTPYYIFDEGSAVPDKIYEVAEGGKTDGEPMHFVFGNPTRNSGRFFEIFHKLRNRWITKQIDSRDAKMTNKKLLDEWIEDWGIDSDFVRVRIRGMFPKAGDMQFIPNDLYFEASTRDLPTFYPTDPLICGVDCARGGEDNAMIQFRRGFDARSEKAFRIPGEKTRDSMQFVSKLCDIFDRYRPHVIFVDVGSMGGPIGDRLRQLGYNAIDVGFGEKAADERHYANRTAEMWDKMRRWMYNGGCIKSHPDLEADLTHREFSHNAKDQLVMEKKDDMKKRGLSSPDWADALALTFAAAVPQLPAPEDEKRTAFGIVKKKVAYNPLDRLDYE